MPDWFFGHSNAADSGDDVYRSDPFAAADAADQVRSESSTTPDDNGDRRTGISESEPEDQPTVVYAAGRPAEPPHPTVAGRPNVAAHPAFAASTAGGSVASPVLQDEEMMEVAQRAGQIATAIATVILGKEEVIRACVVALLAGGHVIVEDFPGVGKTLLAKSLAKSIDCRFARVQFTPDLLPSDVTGVSVFNQKSGEFEFRPGPIFANIVLADEINRASPKTQSSLLECMEERQATIDNVTHAIEPPFMVIATQNPIEYEGTYPLPEAQLDRFMMRLSLGYPAPEAEENIIYEQTSHNPLAELQHVLEGSEVLAMTQAVTRVRVAPALRSYVVDLLTATRQQREIYLGASPRAGIALTRAAKALALLRGRDFVVPKDIKDLAVRVLAHRLMLSPDAKVHGVSAENVVARLLETVPVPQTGG
jgi:MoxR-like ATPase